jgi:hypothetical protein
VRWLGFACLALSVACSAGDYCGRGWVARGSRCVRDDVAQPGGGDDAEDPPPTEGDGNEGGVEVDSGVTDEPDAVSPARQGDGGEAALDSSADAGKGDSGPSQPMDTGVADGSRGQLDGAVDASRLKPDGPVGLERGCTDEAVDAWREFQMSPNAVPTILACYAADPRCDGGICSIDACLKTAAGMVGCDACIASETQCVAQNCATACGVNLDDDACRACACASRCFEAPAGCGTREVDACGDCRGPACSLRLAGRSETVTIPLLFHFVYDRTDAATGLPAYALDASTNETMLDVDAQLEKANAILETARSDARRLQLVRAGVVYVEASAAGACPDPVALINPNRLFGAINVVLTRSSASCPSASINAYAARATGRTLLHEVAHTLGLRDTDYGNAAWQTVEPLHRERDPASSASCYRRGDFTCDTPPDYGYVGENRCGALISGRDLCTQDNAFPFGSGAQLAACNAEDSVVDATGVCSALGSGGRRSYDPERLGLFPDRPANVMSSHTQSVLTPEQLLRMHSYVQWRLGAGSRVPEADQRIRFGMTHGPADPIWRRPRHRDYGLANAHVASVTKAGTFDLPYEFEYEAKNFDPRGSVMGLRFSAGLEGSPSDALRIAITPVTNERFELPRSAIRIRDGVMSLDETFIPPPGPSLLAETRGIRSASKWLVHVYDAVPVRIRDARLEIVQSDRAQINNDRHARGSSDILVYRPSTSRLYTAMNPGNGSLAFGSPVAEQIPALPDAAAKVISGDVDGDGGVDLIARRGASLWFALHAESYATWHAGSIAGSDVPMLSDDVLMGDFDGDGYGDLMRRRPDFDDGHNYSRFAFYRGVGEGSFEALLRPYVNWPDEIRDATGPGFVRWAVGDAVGHGTYDLLLRWSGVGMLTFSHNLTPPPSTSGVIPTYFGGWNPRVDGALVFGVDSDRLLVMDANQDGVADLVTREEGTGRWSAYLKDPVKQLYGPRQPITFGGRATAFSDTDVVLGAAP